MYPLNAKHFGLDQKLTDLLTKFAEDNKLDTAFTVNASPDGSFLHGQFEFKAKVQVVPAEPEAPAEPAAEGPAVISTVQASLIENLLRTRLEIEAGLFDSLKKNELLVTRDVSAHQQVVCLVDGVGTSSEPGALSWLQVQPVLTLGPPVKYSRGNPRALAPLTSISRCWLPATLRGQKPVKGEPVLFRGVAKGKEAWLAGVVTSVREGEVGVAITGNTLVTLAPLADCWTAVAKQEKPATPPAPKAPTKADKRRAMKPGAK